VVKADPLITEWLAADGASVSLGLQHLLEAFLGDAEPDELVRLVPARLGL
jgi:hypothetical protein